MLPCRVLRSDPGVRGKRKAFHTSSQNAEVRRNAIKMLTVSLRIGRSGKELPFMLNARA